MIEDIIELLNKIIKNPNIIDFEILTEQWVNENAEIERYVLYCNIKENRFCIRLGKPSEYYIYIYKDGTPIKKIECTSEKHFEIESLFTELARIYKDKSYNEFIHFFN